MAHQFKFIMKTNFNKSIIGFALVGALAISFSSCKKDNDDDAQLTATISVVNAVEGSAAQDVYVNDSKASTSAVAYGSAASNISTTAGNRTITFKNTGTATATASADVNISASSTQTFYLTKSATGSLSVSAYANESSAPSSGKAKVRFINVAPLLTGTINVTTSTGTAVVNALAFKAASAYQEVNAATAFNVTMAGSLEVTTIAASEIQAGKIYTVWFDSSTTTKAKYHIVVEN